MKKVAFKSGLLIDGTGAEPVANSLVLTEDDKITYAGADREIGPDYEVVDIAGKTIMPGLIDSHLHFSGNLTDDDSDWVLEDVVQKTVVAVQQAHECLENGLTTVGEISRSGIQIRNMVEAGVMKGPRRFPKLKIPLSKPTLTLFQRCNNIRKIKKHQCHHLCVALVFCVAGANDFGRKSNAITRCF